VVVVTVQVVTPAAAAVAVVVDQTACQAATEETLDRAVVQPAVAVVVVHPCYYVAVL
jgi:hypothetical protein